MGPNYGPQGMTKELWVRFHKVVVLDVWEVVEGLTEEETGGDDVAMLEDETTEVVVLACRLSRVAPAGPLRPQRIWSAGSFKAVPTEASPRRLTTTPVKRIMI